MQHHFWLLSWTLLAGTGCAARSPAALHVRYGELDRSQPLSAGQPVIVEFQPGDRIPVALRFVDDAFALSPDAPPLDLVAKRRCFIMVGPERLKTSLNGLDFDEKPKAPGHFRVELKLNREQRGLLVEVVTPKHPDSP